MRLAEQDIRTTYQQYQYDGRQLIAYQKAVHLAEKNFQALTQDYDLGLDTNVDVLQALVTYQETQRALNRAVYAVKTDWCTLSALTAAVTIPVGGDQQ
jgi:outer membrane protein TolC